MTTGTFVKYHYSPSLAAGVVFVLLFALCTLLHFLQMVRARTWFMIPFVIGGAFETAGYIGRIIAAKEAPGPYATGPYILQSITLLVAPALFAASIYMTLGRIVALVRADALLIIPRALLTKIFVAGDVVSFMTQAAGSGLIASKNSKTSKTGKTIIVAGLFIQIIFFGVFTLAAARFHFRIAHQPTPEAKKAPWKKHMLALYAVCLLIFVRSIVRVVEFIQGFNGYIISHEAFLLGFDGSLMFLAMAVMNAIHPGEVARLLRNGLPRTEEDKIEFGNVAGRHPEIN